MAVSLTDLLAGGLAGWLVHSHSRNVLLSRSLLTSLLSYLSVCVSVYVSVSVLPACST